MENDNRHLRLSSFDVRLKDPYHLGSEQEKLKDRVQKLEDTLTKLMQNFVEQKNSNATLTQTNLELSQRLQLSEKELTKALLQIQKLERKSNTLYAEQLLQTQMLEDLQEKSLTNTPKPPPSPPATIPLTTSMSESPSYPLDNTSHSELTSRAFHSTPFPLPLSPTPSSTPIPPTSPPPPGWQKVERKKKNKNKKKPHQVNIQLNPNYNVNNTNGENPFSRSQSPNTQLSSSQVKQAPCPSINAWNKVRHTPRPLVMSFDIKFTFCIRHRACFYS